MKRVVELLFIIGLLINLTKGADLMLRPYQQKWIQSKTETLALWLEYAYPLKWLGKLTTRKAHIVIAIIAVALYYSIFFLWVIPSTSISIFERIIIHGIGFYALCRSAYLFVKWLLSDDNPVKFVHRFILVLIVLIGIIIGGLIVFYVWIGDETISFRIYELGIIKLIILVVVLSLAIALMIAWLIVGIIFPLIILIYLVQTLILLSRAVVWRIVEYNKGVWAALTLLATIVLGSIELYLKVR